MTLAPATPIRVLIVEDSETERRLLEHIVNADPRLSVAGAAASGEAALGMLERLRPGVITMDIRLPGIDGIETTKRIMRRLPTPIVVVATVAADQGKVSFDALQAGAVSVVEKPRGVANRDFESIAARLRRQLVLMSELKLVRRRRSDPPPAIAAPSRPRLRAGVGADAVGVTASTGGPNAIAEILAGIGPDFAAPILIVQHITPSFTDSFVSWLDDLAPMPVSIARAGQTPQCGCAYVAPSDGHLEVAGGRFCVSAKPPVSSQRPSGTVLFESMAKEYGRSCVGVLLTGMGDDGAAGLRAIFNAGGHTIAEDASTAVVSGMPAAAVALGAASEVLPLPKIAPRLREFVSRKVRAAS